MTGLVVTLQTFYARFQAEAAEAFDVNLRTIRRDLILLRHVGFDLVCTDEEHNRKRWRIRQPWERLRTKRQRYAAIRDQLATASSDWRSASGGGPGEPAAPRKTPLRQLNKPVRPTARIGTVEANDDAKYVDKAHRRGKTGWSVGRRVEVAPHYWRPHMALVGTGRGREVPNVVPRKGSVVHR